MATNDKPAATTNVRVKRTILPAPDISDPDRKIYQIEYQIGDLPPRFVYIPEKEYTKEKEAATIKKDLDQRIAGSGEIIKI